MSDVEVSDDEPGFAVHNNELVVVEYVQRSAPLVDVRPFPCGVGTFGIVACKSCKFEHRVPRSVVQAVDGGAKYYCRMNGQACQNLKRKRARKV